MFILIILLVRMALSAPQEEIAPERHEVEPVREVVAVEVVPEIPVAVERAPEPLPHEPDPDVRPVSAPVSAPVDPIEAEWQRFWSENQALEAQVNGQTGCIKWGVDCGEKL